MNVCRSRDLRGEPDDLLPIAVCPLCGIMLLVVRLSGRRMPRSGRTWAGFLVLGALNNFIPFSLIAWGQVHITSGLASILNATPPLFTAVVAHACAEERLAAHRIGGVLLGLVGVAVLIGPDALRHLGASTLGELAIVGAAISMPSRARTCGAFARCPRWCRWPGC